MVLVKAHGANRLALSSAVDIFESAIEVFQDMVVDRPQILGATGVQQSIVEKTLDRVMLRASREGPRHSAEKLVTIILFHLDSDFVKPQVSFAESGNAAFIQDKCYAAVIKWLSLRATLPAVLTEYEVEFERFLKFAFVRKVYGLRPEIRTKKNLWDAMAVLGLKEYLNSTPAVRASFQRRIAQIYATAVDALEQSKCDGKDLAATVTEKTLDLLQSQKPHDGVSWLMMMQTQKRTALHTFKVLLYHCEVVPPGMRVALDDSTLAVMCAETATRWKQVRDSTEPPASKSSYAALFSATEPSLAASLPIVLPSSPARSSPLPSALVDDTTDSSEDRQESANVLHSCSSLKTNDDSPDPHNAGTEAAAIAGDRVKNLGAGKQPAAAPRGEKRATVATLCPVKRLHLRAVKQSVESQIPSTDTREVRTEIRDAVEIYTIVDDTPPAIDDVPTVPLHWHFVHDPEDFWLSEARGQKGGFYFGVSLESLRVSHWPRMTKDQRKEASRLRAATIESYKSAEIFFQALRLEVSGTNIAAKIATQGSD